MPAFLQTQAARLRFEVGELTAGHLMQIDLRGRGLQAGFESRILAAHRLEVVADFADGLDVQSRVPLGMAQRLDHGAQGGLGGVAAEAVHRAIHRVHARLGRGQNGGAGDARGVVRVEVDRQPDLLFQRADQDFGRGRFQQTRHVFQAQNMRTCVAQLFRHANVVFQVIFRAIRVQNIAGIANGAFTDFTVLDDRVHGHTHILDPVQRVEHAEHIDILRRLADKFLHHIVGVVGIANPVRAAQQHLGHQIRHRFAQVAQTLPRAFLQEPIGHIERCTAPAFDREQLRQVRGIGRRHLDHVDRAHPRGQQRLVPVPHGGVGDQQLSLRLHPVGHGLRAFLFQQVAGAHLRLGLQGGRFGLFQVGAGFGAVLGFGMPVHGDIRDIGQDLGPTVAALFELEQVRSLVDELGRVFIRQKGRVFQQVFDKGDIGRHTPHTEFTQRAVHAGNRLFRRGGPCRDLGQQRVVVPCDHTACIGGAAIQTDTHTRR